MNGNGLGMIVTGFLFGLGFHVAGWIWGALVGLIQSRRKE